MDNLAALRDEVNEPLGFPLAWEPRPAGTTAWKMWPLAAPAVVAFAMAVFPFGRDEAPRVEPLAATRGAPPAQATAKPPPSPAPAGVDDAAPPPAAAAARIEAASGVRVTPSGGAMGPPTPLIIDVQQALDAQKPKAAPGAQR